MAKIEPRERPRGGPLGRFLKGDRPAVMGILNVTPDSFSDGGRFFDPATAIRHAEAMAGQGADILDIGAESTRPYGGQKPVTAEDEIARLAPVLSEIVKLGLPVSIDTIKADVARWALDHGAMILNDVWGLQKDAAMAPLAAEYGVPVIVMHNREAADAIDIMADVLAFLGRSVEIAEKAGIARDRIVVDPRHRLRQDAGAEHRDARQAGPPEGTWPARAGRRVAQALYRHGVALDHGRAHRRFAGGACSRRRSRRGDHPGA
jgi:dihydropteroate synthase